MSVCKKGALSLWILCMGYPGARIPTEFPRQQQVCSGIAQYLCVALKHTLQAGIIWTLFFERPLMSILETTKVKSEVLVWLEKEPK